MPTSSPPRTMPARVRQSSLYGPNGQPLSYWLYPSPRHNLKQYKPRYWLANDTKSNVSEYDRYELVNYSRQLYAQIDVLNAAIESKNNWAFGDAWDPHYCGKRPPSDKWVGEATEFLKWQFYPMANVRGPQYSFKRSLWLSGLAWDVDGDDVMVTVASPNDFPQLAFYPAPKIANYGDSLHGGKMAPESTVTGGPFDGAKIFDGVIYDRNSRAVGVRLVGEDGQTTDVSSFSADLAYEPKWHDQGRGIPRIAASLLKWMNLQDIDEFLQRGMKRAASIGLIQKNEEGEAPVGNEVFTEEPDTTQRARGTPQIVGAPRNIAYEEIEGGEMYYLSSLGNESIEALTFKNPHPNSEAFIRRVQLCALASIGWHYELINLSETGRAAARLLSDLANQSIWSRQRTGYRRFKRAVSYAIAKAMKTGRISRNDDGMDPYMWEPGLPKPLSVDAGNDAQADREALKMGITTRAILAQKHLGIHESDLAVQRDREIRRTVEMAVSAAHDFPDLSFDRALELYEQRSPNPISTKVSVSQQAKDKATTV